MNQRASETGVLQGPVAQSFAVLTFRTNDQVYALPITAVRQLIEMVAITPVPEASPTIQGVINVHGEIVPVMDLRLRLGLPFKAYQLHTPIILLQVNGRSLALVVDEVETVIDVNPADLQTDETVFEYSANPQASYFSSFAKVNKQLIIIIDADRLIGSQLETGLAQVLPTKVNSVTKAETEKEWAGV